MATANDELLERLNRRRQTLGDSLLAGKKWYTGPPPDAPSYPELVSASDVSVKIKWTPPALPEAPPAESKAPGAPQPRAPKEFVYKVEYGYKYSVSSAWEVAANNVRVPKYTIEGLDPNTTYAARVYAKYAEGGEWGPPSASSWGLPTLTQAAAAEIRAEKEREHEAALKRSVAAVEEQRREQAAQRQRARTEELERALAATKSEADRERLLRENAERERDELDADRQRRQAEAAKLQERLAKVTREQEAFAAKAAAATAAETKRREEAMAFKAAADAAAAARSEESLKLQKQLRQLADERKAMEDQHRRKVAEDAEKSEAEKARLQAERAAEVAALRESQQQLAHKLEKIESDKVEAARLAEKRAKQDAKRLAEAHAKLKEESAAIVAKQQAKVAELKAKLEGLRLHHESVQADASSKIEEEAARKTEAEELVQFQIEQAERAAAQTNTQVVELRQQVAKFEQMLLAAKTQAESSAKTAEACTNTIVLQAQENEFLRRKARYQAATIRSLQGAGPNPELESELVRAGHARENVRFFMEVNGHEDKKKITALLSRLQELRQAHGFPDDAIREALTVCTDESKVEAYLREYVEKHHTGFASGAGGAAGAGAASDDGDLEGV